MTIAKPAGEPRHIDFGNATYWDIIETALVGLPESDPFRAPALRALDHLKERVLTNYARAQAEDV